MGNEVERTLVDKNILDRITALENAVRNIQTTPIQANELSEFAPDIGLITGGEFRVYDDPLDPREPGDGFSGIRMVGDGGAEYDSAFWGICGVNNDELTFGLRASDGAALFARGAGVIDAEGIKMSGLNYVIRQYAIDPTATNARYGWLEMFMLSGGSIPAWGMTYSDSTGSPITNGDFETGDLTGWTDAGTDFTVTESAANSGTYGLECADVSSGTATLTSDRFACDAGLPYFFRFRTNEHGYTSGTDTVYTDADTNIRNDSPDYSYGSAVFLNVGEANTGTFTARSLLHFDLSSYNPLTVVSSAILNIYEKAEYSSNARTMRVYRMLRDWVEGSYATTPDGATWNTYDGTNAWGAAGAADTSTDREATDIGNRSFSATETIEEWKQITLTAAKVQEWISAALANYGIQLKMDTENNDLHILSAKEYYTPANLSLTYTTPSDYTIRVDFYDDPTAGSLVSSVTLCTEYNAAGWRQVNKQVVPPVGAVSAEIVIEASTGLGFYVDDITMLFTRALYCTDDGWDSSQGLWAQSWSGWLGEFQFYTAAGARKTPSTITIASSNFYSGREAGVASANASNGDYEIGYIPLFKGTYTWMMSYAKATSAGKHDLYVDGVKVTSTPFDMYGSSAFNQLWTQASIDVGYNGVHEFKIVANGKNASSSDYIIQGSDISIYRTA